MNPSSESKIFINSWEVTSVKNYTSANANFVIFYQLMLFLIKLFFSLVYFKTIDYFAGVSFFTHVILMKWFDFGHFKNNKTCCLLRINFNASSIENIAKYDRYISPTRVHNLLRTKKIITLFFFTLKWCFGTRWWWISPKNWWYFFWTWAGDIEDFIRAKEDSIGGDFSNIFALFQHWFYVHSLSRILENSFKLISFNKEYTTRNTHTRKQTEKMFRFVYFALLSL